MPTPMTSALKRRLLAAAFTVPVMIVTAGALAQEAGTPPPPPAAAGAPSPGAMETASPPAPGRDARSVTVNELRDMGAIRLEGRVAETFGNAFVLEDATGRTLVETGPEGDRRELVKTGDQVVVDGRFDRGQVQARGIAVGGGERVALERPRPERDGPRGPGREGPGPDGPGRDGPERDGPRGPHEHGPRHGPDGKRAEEGGWGWLGGGVDEAAATKALTDAGYGEVALVDTLKHHAEFTAKDASGTVWRVKVDEDNRVAEREPYVAPMSEEAAKAAVEKLGYSYEGGFETRRDHVEVDAKDGGGKPVLIELNPDGSLRKERFDS